MFVCICIFTTSSQSKIIFFRSLFSVSFLQINAEFLRITALPLQSRFMASLDRQSSQLLQVIRSKGGVIREKTKDTIKVMEVLVACKQNCLWQSI